MIRRHDFNSRWWGGDVGIVDDPEKLLAASDAERARALEAYAWVELRAPLEHADPERIGRCGFFQVDTQLQFRLGCARVATTSDIDSLVVTRASEKPFRIEAGDLASFGHERYRHLATVGDERLAERYARWAGEQISRSPAWCLRIEAEGSVQGWFLAQMTPEGLNLELAMLHRDATVSGMYVYQRSIVEYARLGARVGYARFSVENTPVHNIYARLGAQFLGPVGVWFWVRR